MYIEIDPVERRQPIGETLANGAQSDKRILCL
jgi:hypothetical protein